MLTDGTYFINRWLATIEIIPKTIVPVGYVGVVVSYCGPPGKDVSGDAFRHGERVSRGERGLWDKPFGPGKYPFNTYAGQMIMVPTTNFALHWVTGKSESHQYDDQLQSIDLVTKEEHLSKSQQPLVPQHMFVAGGSGDGANGLACGPGLLGTLANLLVAGKSGFKFDGSGQTDAMKQLARKLTEQAMNAMQESGNVDRPPAPVGPADPVVQKAAPSFGG